MHRPLSWALVALLGASACGDEEVPSPMPDASDGSPDASAPDGAAEGDAGDAAAEAGYDWQLPPGFPLPPVPEDNPITAEKVELGRHLFYDKRLSGNGTQSCASCHEQKRAFADDRKVGLGSTGELHKRGSMSLANVAYASTLTWANPDMVSLERQAQVPLFDRDPVELGAGTPEDLVARLREVDTYQQLFPAAFPEEADPVNVLNITRALASFQRTLISGNSPFDRFERGDKNAVSESAKRGKALFDSERFDCFHCHGGTNYSDQFTHLGKSSVEKPFHNTGLYNLDPNGAYPQGNQGVYEHTLKLGDVGRFKAPTLRNIAVTAPYMHDGSIETLEEVIEHYAQGGRTLVIDGYVSVGFNNPRKNEFVHGVERITEQERQDLLEFLRSLTDEGFLNDPRFSDPWPAQEP